jgi:hypothetical protein
LRVSRTFKSWTLRKYEIELNIKHVTICFTLWNEALWITNKLRKKQHIYMMCICGKETTQSNRALI